MQTYADHAHAVHFGAAFQNYKNTIGFAYYVGGTSHVVSENMY